MRPGKKKIVLMLVLGLLPAACQVQAQDEPWMPPEPSPESLDWIQLTSGEWLRGEIHVLRDDMLEFESEELDNLDLDWEDVAQLRTPRILTFAFEENGVFTGTAVMQGDVISIRSAEGVRELSRSDLLSVIEGKPSEWNYWSCKVSLGLIFRSGNTDQDDLNSIVLIRRQATRARVDLEYKGNFAKANDVETVNNQLASAKFDYLISKGFFVTPLAGQLYADRFQNIDLRSTLSAGAGYYLYRRSNLEWRLGLSGGYTHTSFTSTEAGEPTTENSAVAIPATNLEMDISKALELTFDLNAQVTLPDTKGTIYHTFLLFSFEWTSLLDFDVSFTWDRLETPKAEADGNVPERDDLRVAFGLGLDF